MPFMQNYHRQKYLKVVVAIFGTICLILGSNFVQHLTLFPEFIPRVIAKTTEEEIVWQCSASGANSHYVVDQLVNKDGAIFDVAIYQVDRSRPSPPRYSGEEYGDYLETVTLTIKRGEGSSLEAKGRSSSGMMTIEAFGRTVAFNVKEGNRQSVTGRCDRFWKMASAETRREVRECLAEASRRNKGTISQVEEFGCTFPD